MRRYRVALAICALLALAVFGAAGTMGSKKGPCDEGSITAPSVPACANPGVGNCSFVYPVCEDPCGLIGYTNARCDNISDPCLEATVTGPAQVCRDCRCDDYFSGSGNCLDTAVYEVGETSYIDC